MNIEKLDRVVIYVEDLEKSRTLYADLLGIEFDNIPFPEVDPVRMTPGDSRNEQAADGDTSVPPANWKVAISRVGLELIEGALPAGAAPFVACYHFKVTNYDDAKAEMSSKSVPLISNITLGKLQEAIYQPEGDSGPMLGLVCYPDTYVMDSIKSKGS